MPWSTSWGRYEAAAYSTSELSATTAIEGRVISMPLTKIQP
jgi:hypothetical protein